MIKETGQTDVARERTARLIFVVSYIQSDFNIGMPAIIIGV